MAGSPCTLRFGEFELGELVCEPRPSGRARWALDGHSHGHTMIALSPVKRKIARSGLSNMVHSDASAICENLDVTESNEWCRVT